MELFKLIETGCMW